MAKKCVDLIYGMTLGKWQAAYLVKYFYIDAIHSVWHVAAGKTKADTVMEMIFFVQNSNNVGAIFNKLDISRNTTSL